MTHRHLAFSMACCLMALALVPARVAAQNCSAAVPTGSCTASTSASMVVGTILQLSLNASATTLTPPSTAQYDAGFVADNGPVATVMSNRAWTVQIRSAAALWTATNTVVGVTARVNKPAADLQWSTSAGGPFVGVTTTGTTFMSGAATAGTIRTAFFRTLYNWVLDTPGAYRLVVVFTLSAP